jgi:CRP/FNR family transcriptional regulator
MVISVPDAISNFFKTYRLSRYAKGQIFLLEGEKADYIYYLVEGRVKIYTVSYRGDDVVLYIHKPPDVFPVSNLLNQTMSDYIYEADSETVVRRAPMHEMKKLIESQPAVAFGLLKQAHEHISYFLEKQAALMDGSAKRKLMYELVAQYRRFHTDSTNDEYLLDIHEKELAARTGLSRETVNREIRKLKRENLIALIHHRIVIPSITGLEAKLHQSR